MLSGSTQAKFQQAITLHQKGELNSAEALYQEVLALEPNHADTLHFLGLIDYQNGKLDSALHYIQQAIQINPKTPTYHTHLGNVFMAQQNYLLALQAYQQALQLNPKHLSAHNNIASTYKQMENYTKALHHYQQALEIEPNSADTYYNLGNLYDQMDQKATSLEYYRKALELQPNYCEAHYQLGSILSQKGEIALAEQHLLTAIHCNPGYQPTYYALGYFYENQRNYQQALTAYGQSLQLNPQHLDSLNSIGRIFYINKQYPEALDFYRQAQQLAPSEVTSYHYIGMILVEQGLLKEAIQQFRQVVELNPIDASSYSNLANALLSAGQMSDGLINYKKALELAPSDPRIFSSVLFASYLQPNYQEQEIFKLYQQWAKKFQYPQPVPQHRFSQRLKIGYVSGDFNNHSAARVFQLLFQNHNPQQVNIFAYANVKNQDTTTETFKQLVHHWRDIYYLSDQQVIQLIKQDQIDILVDLSGHTNDHRLAIFAQKPAPIQVTGLGYGRTTGLPTIDYLLSDQYIHPPARSRFNSEKVFYLSSLIRWTEPDDMIKIQPVTCNYPVFGCGNHLFKLNQEVITTWSQILQQLPQAKLYLKAKEFNDESLREEMFQRFEKLQISREHIQLFGGTTAREHMEFYNSIDIALDPFPYNGGITICETSWMGVPTIALKGGTGSGHSIMALLGLEDLVAKDTNEYVQLAIQLAQDTQRLQQLRQSLRTTLLASPICNGPLFAREMENAYQIMWQNWLKQGKKYD